MASYLNSGFVQVFPSGFRGTDYNKSKLTTEENITLSTYASMSSIKKLNEQFFVDPYDSNYYILVLKGYVFKVQKTPLDTIIGGYSNNCYAIINTKSIKEDDDKIGPILSDGSSIGTLDTNSVFKGLVFDSVESGTCSLLIGVDGVAKTSDGKIDIKEIVDTSGNYEDKALGVDGSKIVANDLSNVTSTTSGSANTFVSSISENSKGQVSYQKSSVKLGNITSNGVLDNQIVAPDVKDTLVMSDNKTGAIKNVAINIAATVSNTSTSIPLNSAVVSALSGKQNTITTSTELKVKSLTANGSVSGDTLSGTTSTTTPEVITDKITPKTSTGKIGIVNGISIDASAMSNSSTVFSIGSTATITKAGAASFSNQVTSPTVNTHINGQSTNTNLNNLYAPITTGTTGQVPTFVSASSAPTWQWPTYRPVYDNDIALSSGGFQTIGNFSFDTYGNGLYFVIIRPYNEKIPQPASGQTDYTIIDNDWPSNEYVGVAVFGVVVWGTGTSYGMYNRIDSTSSSNTFTRFASLTQGSYYCHYIFEISSKNFNSGIWINKGVTSNGSLELDVSGSNTSTLHLTICKVS